LQQHLHNFAMAVLKTFVQCSNYGWTWNVVFTSEH